MEAIASHRPDLAGAWQSMLGHQLPALPDLENSWAALPDFFQWMMGGAEPPRPQAYGLAAGETVVRERTLGLALSTAAQSHIEIIRFAAANRLCVDIDYDPLTGLRGVRRVEPYSLRRTADGEIILHVEKFDTRQHRTYRVDRIRGVEVSSETFTPRHDIELSPDQAVRIPDSIRSFGPSSAPAVSRPQVARRNSQGSSSRRKPGTSSTGPVYVFECTSCGKRFRRNSHDGTLNDHKNKQGYPCYGRVGRYVETKH